jgi:CMP-N,N'-diacetyllegionaminic acid synthase
MIALIPARAGSKRIPGKNWKNFCGKPLICYTIETAIATGMFQDQIYVSSDSKRIKAIVEEYKCVNFIQRPSEYALETSPDQEWIDHVLKAVSFGVTFFYAILRPTNPFRTAGMVKRAYAEWDKRHDMKAVELVKQRPEKMWELYARGQLMLPYRSGTKHLQQSSSFDDLYIQNGCIEFRVKPSFNYDVYQPFLTKGCEGFDINTPEDWILAETLVEKGLV